MARIPSRSTRGTSELARLIADLVDERGRGGEGAGWRRVLLDPALRADLDACLRAFDLLEADTKPRSPHHPRLLSRPHQRRG